MFEWKSLNRDERLTQNLLNQIIFMLGFYFYAREGFKQKIFLLLWFQFACEFRHSGTFRVIMGYGPIKGNLVIRKYRATFMAR
jgi:hypothetical protein